MSGVYYECREHWFETVKEWSRAIFYSGCVVASTISLYSLLDIPEVMFGLGLCMLPIGSLSVELMRRNAIRYTLVEIDGDLYVSRKERKLNPFKAFPWREDQDPKENKTLTMEGNVYSDFIGYTRMWVRLGQMTSFTGLRVPKEFATMYRTKAPKEDKEETDAVKQLKVIERMMDKGYVGHKEGQALIRGLLTA